MTKLTLAGISEAAERLHGVAHVTLLDRSETFSRMTGSEIYLKYEHLQKTGSFKIRGAYNKLCELKNRGGLTKVITASAGNHAQGVAYASAKLGIPATIVMPKTAPLAKVSATEGYGADIVLEGDGYDSAYTHALELQRENGAEFIPAFDDLAVIAGQGTIGREILSELPDTDVIFVPVGGGGLLAGTAFYIKNVNPRVRIIGVQAEGADAVARSYRVKGYTAIESASTIADGIAVKTPGLLTQELINEYADDVVTVSDAEISSAMLNLLERCKQMVEPAGASALAAALKNSRGKKCVCLLSGGNTDVGFMHRIIELGLAARNRRLRFKTAVPDTPGSLTTVSGILMQELANIISVRYERASLNPQEAILHIECEVSGKAHGERVLNALAGQGCNIVTE